MSLSSAKMRARMMVGMQQWTVSFFFIASLLVSGCVSSDNGAGAGGRDSCSAGETRCRGDAYQECKSGHFSNQSICAGITVCSESLGCVECRPEEAKVCVGDTVHSCGADGTIGGSLEQCPLERCFGGTCGGGDSNCGTSGTSLVYVVDDSSNLFSFDPTKLSTPADPFTRIGVLSCPASASLGIPIGSATPFSMSVDRNGKAWVLYTSGEIFLVSTTNASCERSDWSVGKRGFEQFGMGFATDSSGSNEETLYISGGSASNPGSGNIGAIHPADMSVTTLGPIPSSEQNPELTGTGDGKLYGYFPGATNTFVANLDKSTGAKGQSWNTANIPGGASAWAFAQWGGRFYIFVSSGSLISTTNAVYELDPDTGTSTKVIASSAYRIVGAGVSTCAPTQID